MSVRVEIFIYSERGGATSYRQTFQLLLAVVYESETDGDYPPPSDYSTRAAR